MTEPCSVCGKQMGLWYTDRENGPLLEGGVWCGRERLSIDARRYQEVWWYHRSYAEARGGAVPFCHMCLEALQIMEALRR